MMFRIVALVSFNRVYIGFSYYARILWWQKAKNFTVNHRKNRMYQLELDAVRILDAIDRRGSFAAAAEELHRVASTVSYAVAKLEDGLGVRLFERAGPRVSLTPAGRELLKDGRDLLRLAAELEARVKRIANGWETEIRVTLDGMFSPACLASEIADFCSVAPHTRFKISQETLSGTWEALLDGRADLVVGVAGDGPSGGGYHMEAMGSLDYVFAVAPNHPLANCSHTLSAVDLAPFRAVSVGDSARSLPVRTVGLHYGQPTLVVPDMRTKLDYQLRGLGFGFLPEQMARHALANGRLIRLDVAQPRPSETFYLAWPSGERGAALEWWLDRMRHPAMFERMIGSNTL